MVFLRSSEDYRMSSGSDAPEVDNAWLAPELQGDDVAPEVDPGRDMQVFYNDAPPEAVTVPAEPSDDSANPPSSDRAPAHKSRTKLIALVLITTVLVAAALGIGLGLGLVRRGRDDTTDPTSTTASGSSNASTLGIPQATNQVLQRAMVNNTPLAAITLPNGNRHIFFQERTGNFRRAIFSSRAKIWRASIDAGLPFYPKNTPALAVVPGLNKTERGDETAVTLFYVHPEKHTIECVDWGHSSSAECTLLADLPNNSVAPDSQQIFVAVLAAGDYHQSLLLTYQHSSHNLVMMQGYTYHRNNPKWYWRNETDKFNSKMSGYLPQGPHVVAACNGAWYAEIVMCANGFACKPDQSLNRSYLFCFVEPGESIAEFQIAYQNIQGGKITVEGWRYWGDEAKVNRSILGSSDIALLSPGQPLYFDQSTMRVSATHHGKKYRAKLPLPNTPFPFNRLASTFARNGTNSYLYHQISDSIISEDLWDDTSGFWITSNITIETS
ncbi:MAG: hypothetical protein Q9208_008833 [Pyrenodesmia sp. 3 TL-2023]